MATKSPRSAAAVAPPLDYKHKALQRIMTAIDTWLQSADVREQLDYGRLPAHQARAIGKEIADLRSIIADAVTIRRAKMDPLKMALEKEKAVRRIVCQAMAWCENTRAVARLAEARATVGSPPAAVKKKV